MRHFSANILNQKQRTISDRFARPFDGNKWEGIAYQMGELGVPVLDDALAAFECAVEHRIEAGDHMLVIGKVLRMHGPRRAEPLVFFGSRYRALDLAEAFPSSSAEQAFLGWGI